MVDLNNDIFKSIDIKEDYLETDLSSNCADYTDWNIQAAYLDNINYEDFFKNYLIPNRPCIVKNVSDSWKCTESWVVNHKINYNYLKQQYGDLKAPVADCNNIMYNSQCKQDMSIVDFMNYMQYNDKKEVLYLKDWHLRKSRIEDQFYTIPIIFGSDWLNEYSVDKKEDDFMFVYIGPKSSWTPLHADVYSSYSWSVNVVGQKKWVLFPPGEEEKLKDSLGNLPVLYKPELFNGIKYYVVSQEKGNAIFVPSGWYHQVFNELDTISVNHNWINGCNIQKVWEALSNTLISVEHEINEYRHTEDFPEQCQLILKSLFGMDFAHFINFLCHIGQKRLSQLEGSESPGLGGFHLGKNQIKFDLIQLLKVLNKCFDHSVFVKHRSILSNIQYDVISLRNSISSALN